ncbi:MAG: sigma 54-interacting transcriptional regulator [Desulfocurvibacter africanus]
MDGLNSGKSTAWNHPPANPSAAVNPAEGKCPHCQKLERRLEEFRQTEAMLLQSENKLTRLFNNLPGMAYRCRIDDDLDYSLDFVSNGCLELLGVPPEELTQQQTNALERMMHAEDLPFVRDDFRRAMLERKPYKLMYRICTSRDEVKWVCDQGEAVVEGGRVVFCDGIIIDISDQKLREVELLLEKKKLVATLHDHSRFYGIIGSSEPMREVYRLILKAAKCNANVVIFGETGTGKDLVARTIHSLSERQGPYVPVNCGAIPAQLMESEFFGHKRGAFSGALNDRKGYLAAADGGTLFLDEVGEIDLKLQVNLLRVLESRQYTALGDPTPRSSNFRLITATHSDLKQMVREGRMRSDFFYRVHVLPIYVPPLRDRMEDIPLLVETYLPLFAGKSRPPQMTPAMLRQLEEYHWPGNIRELQNVLQRFVTFGKIMFSNPGEEDSQEDLPPEHPELHEAPRTLGESVERLEKRLIQETLERFHWKKSATAAALGLTLRTLQRKTRRYGL